MEGEGTGARIARAMARPAGRVGTAIAFAVALAGAAACVRLTRGYFLADDFVQLANFGYWQAQGRLGDEVLARFVGSIDGVNGFWRPLTFVSFVANYVADGGHARGWLAVNLALHLANAVLAGWIVVRLAGGRSRAALAGAIAAAALFFVLSPGWEAALWIACRYDSLATFFTLLAGACFLAGRRGLAFAACVAALLSKEAGAVALAFVCVLAMLPTTVDVAAANRWRGWLRTVAPWLALGAAYAAVRWMLFGSPTEVYRGVHPQLDSAAHWQTLYATGIGWAHEVFPGFPGLRGLAGASAGAIAGALVLAARRDRRALASLVAILAMGALAVALLVPHLLGFETNGIGGRLFYQASAFYGIALGLALGEALLALGARPAWAGVTAACIIALIAANAAWGWTAVREYLSSERSMREAAAAIAQVVATSREEEFDLVIVPDAIGRVPFGRNAQAGLMLPPVQARAISSRLLVQTDVEIPALDKTVDRGILSALRVVAVHDLLEGRAPAGPWPRLAPARVFCWHVARRAMVQLPVRDPGAGALGAEVARAYEAAGCRAPARK